MPDATCVLAEFALSDYPHVSSIKASVVVTPWTREAYCLLRDPPALAHDVLLSPWLSAGRAKVFQCGADRHQRTSGKTGDFPVPNKETLTHVRFRYFRQQLLSGLQSGQRAKQIPTVSARVSELGQDLQSGIFRKRKAILRHCNRIRLWLRPQQPRAPVPSGRPSASLARTCSRAIFPRRKPTIRTFRRVFSRIPRKARKGIITTIIICRASLRRALPPAARVRPSTRPSACLARICNRGISSRPSKRTPRCSRTFSSLPRSGSRPTGVRVAPPRRRAASM